MCSFGRHTYGYDNFETKESNKGAKIDSMAVNQSFAAAHTLLFLIYAQYSVF